jgi:hypothetical protein
MENSLIDDKSTGRPAGWDMGTGDDRQQESRSAPGPEVKQEAKTVAAQVAEAPAPGAQGNSPWRHTTTPQPASTHSIFDAAKLTTGQMAKSPENSKFGGNIPNVWQYDTEPFPNDLRACYAILRILDGYQVLNRHASKEWLRRRGLLGKHIALLSNGPKAPEMTADVVAGLQKAQHERPAAMAARLAELQTYLANPITAELATLDIEAEANDPESRSKLSIAPKTRLILHPAIAQ